MIDGVTSSPFIVSAAATLAVPLTMQTHDRTLASAKVEPGLVDKYFATLLGVGLVLAIASATRFYCVNWLGERVYRRYSR